MPLPDFLSKGREVAPVGCVLLSSILSGIRSQQDVGVSKTFTYRQIGQERYPVAHVCELSVMGGVQVIDSESNNLDSKLIQAGRGDRPISAR